MQPVPEFLGQPPEFWALAKFVGQELKYTARASGRHGTPARLRRTSTDEVAERLRLRGLDPSGAEGRVAKVVEYIDARADLLESIVQPNLMSRDQARDVFDEIRKRVSPPPSLISMNKRKGEQRHEAYLSCIVNMLTHEALGGGESATFDPSPRRPLTFARSGIPLRTLSRWMDGAFPDANHPHATWEVKEYYGTTSFGSRVADGVYETALDGYELNDLRAVGIEVEHYLLVDGHDTWWKDGKSYLCRIVDMLHSGLLDGAFFGRETVSEWPSIVDRWVQ